MEFTDLNLRIPNTIALAKVAVSGSLRAAKIAAELAITQANARAASLQSRIEDVAELISPLQEISDRKLRMATFVPLSSSDVETWSSLSLRIIQSLMTLDGDKVSGLLLVLSSDQPAALLELADKLSSYTGVTVSLDGLRWDDEPEILERGGQRLPSYKELTLGEAVPQLATASAKIGSLLEVAQAGKEPRGLVVQSARASRGIVDYLDDIEEQLDRLSAPELAGIRALWIEDLPKGEVAAIVDAPGAPDLDAYAAAVVFITDLMLLKDLL